MSNGFLLVVHLDALFDRRLRTAGATRASIPAPSISREGKLRLGITESLKLLWDSPGHEPFLREHRGRFQAKPLTTA